MLEVVCSLPCIAPFYTMRRAYYTHHSALRPLTYFWMSGFLNRDAGTLDDYRVRSDFGTAFRFSRFDSSAALVRNVSALGGNIGAKHEHAHPGREAGR